MRFIAITGLLLTVGCASPHFWVAQRTPNSGAIGYQNYNPRSDNGRLLEAQIPCKDYKMLWTGVKSSQGAPTYQFINGVMVPIDNGLVQWAEFHYECPNTEAMVLTPGK